MRSTLVTSSITTAALSTISSAIVMFYVPLSVNGICTLLLIVGLFELIIALAIDLYADHIKRKRRRERIMKKLAYSKSLYAVPDSRY